MRSSVFVFFNLPSAIISASVVEASRGSGGGFERVRERERWNACGAAAFYEGTDSGRFSRRDSLVIGLPGVLAR